MKTQLEIAKCVVAGAFQNQKRNRIADVVALGKLQGVSLRSVQRAAAALGVVEVHNGRLPAFWELN